MDKKIGELFLKAAFRYASANRLENIFIHGDIGQHKFLFELIEDFGFVKVGNHPGAGQKDAVYVKRHPLNPPEDTHDAFEYLRTCYPHFKKDSSIGKYVVPIRPEFHRILFPDYISPENHQLTLFRCTNEAGNAIKLAYLCHAPTNKIKRGDIVMFYRSGDERAITSLGVVEYYDSHTDPAIIASHVRRRTVYSMGEIEDMAKKPTKVMLFRLVRHFNHPLNQEWLESANILKGAPQSIMSISHDAFERIFTKS